MPILVRDYQWEDSEGVIAIIVPLKGAKTSNIDVLTTDKYIKVSYPPFYFECLLYGSVDDIKGTATINGGTIVFRLPKTNPGVWPHLYSSDFANKEIMKQRREEAILKVQEKAERAEKEKVEQKREREKFSVKEAMRIDQEERERIEKQKKEEKYAATQELELWKQKQIEEATIEQEKLLRSKMESETANKLNVEKKKIKDKQNIFENKSKESVREIGKIEVTFTPRVFPTAARESQKEQEDQWLQKQVERRRAASNILDEEDLSEEEKNPAWLEDKGNSLYMTGNYLGAINAYTLAIRMSPEIPSLHSNRAACHLKLGNLMKCIEDASRALELLTPPVKQNAASRAKAHIRRGSAFSQMEMYVEGLMDYEAAIKLTPDDESIKEDAEKIRCCIQGTKSSSVE